MDISLRDYFAGQALQGLLSNQELAKDFTSGGDIDVQKWHGETSYAFADVMLKARDVANK